MKTLELRDEQLHLQAGNLASLINEKNVELLWCLREIEERMVYAKFGFSSLFRYVVEYLKFSEGSAWRRIAAMRLLVEVPEIEEKIVSGALNLTTLSRIEKFVEQECLDHEEKVEVLKHMEGKSTREVEKILVQASSKPERMVQEIVKLVQDELFEVVTHFSKDEMNLIQELQAIRSHSLPSQSIRDLVVTLVNEDLERRRIKTPRGTPPPESHTRYTPAETKRQLHARDGDGCTFVNPETGQRCGSKHFLQMDHIKPFALGGKTSLENLRLRCHAHNQLHARQTFGPQRSQNAPNCQSGH